jgi:hypothetical protein
MLAGVSLELGDRVLFLSIPDLPLLMECAAAVPRGIVVAMGAREAVYAVRAACAHLENVMVTPATPDEIPWQESFFSWVIETSGGWTMEAIIAREIARVLAPGGAAWLAGVDWLPLIEAGLFEAESGASHRVLRKAGEPPSASPANGHFNVL